MKSKHLWQRQTEIRFTEEDIRLMKLALEQAQEAFDEGEVPVGAVLIDASGNVFRNRNRTRQNGSPSAHAEHLVISEGTKRKEDWRLEDCTLYTTLEPCLMCAGLIILSRIPRVVYGAWDKRFGAFGSITDVMKMQGLNHYPEISGGCLADESSNLLKEFFRSKR